MVLSLTDLENRVNALEAENKKLARLLRIVRPRTDNPLSLSTDLDDLGSVHTWLEVWETSTPAANPKAETLYLYATSGVEGARLTYLDEAGVVHTPFSCLDGELAFAQGSEGLTVGSGTRVETVQVTHNKAWSTVGRVYLTIQDANTFAAGERPVSANAYTVTANSFYITVDCHANVASNRGINVGWLATGVL